MILSICFRWTSETEMPRRRAAIAQENWHRAAFNSIVPMLPRRENNLVVGYSVADIVVTPNLARQIDLGVGLPEKYPRVRAWVARLMQRPSYRSIAELCRSTERRSESGKQIELG